MRRRKIRGQIVGESGLGPDPASYASGKRVTGRQDGLAPHGVLAGVNEAGFLIVRKDDGTDELILAGGVRAAGARRG
jgi:hypothetical protein